MLEPAQRGREAAGQTPVGVVESLETVDADADVGDAEAGPLLGDTSVDPHSVGRELGRDTGRAGMADQVEEIVAQQGLAAAEDQDTDAAGGHLVDQPQRFGA